MTEQPEALRHAEWLELSLAIGAQDAAAELRRLHELHELYQDKTQRQQSRIATLETALWMAVEALEKLAAYRPLTFAECSDAEAVMGIAERGVTTARQTLGGKP